MINSVSIIDQKKNNNSNSSITQALISYTEPLTKKLALNLNYTLNNANSEQNIQSFDKRNGVYDSLNLLYSNHYKFISTSNRSGFTLNYNNKKLSAKIGLAIQDLSMKQTNLYKDSSFQRNFTNYFPTANVRWKYSTAGNIYFSYDGSTRQPSLNQIQPIANNTDPLNVVIGNPDLKPSFVHNFYFNLGNFKILTNRNIWGYGYLSVTQNAFSNKDVIDAFGRRTYQTVNVDGNYNYYGVFSYGRKIGFMNLDINFGPRINGNRNHNFINGIANTTNS